MREGLAGVCGGVCSGAILSAHEMLLVRYHRRGCAVCPGDGWVTWKRAVKGQELQLVCDMTQTHQV